MALPALWRRVETPGALPLVVTQSPLGVQVGVAPEPDISLKEQSHE